MIKVKRTSSHRSNLKLFTDFNAALGEILKHVRTCGKLDWCTIFTYGIYAGIRRTPTGVVKSLKNPCYQLLAELNNCKVPTSIHVGLNDSETLKERIQDIESTFPTVKCSLYKGHHKLMLLSDGWGYFGSCNFTGSSIGDLIIAGNLYDIADFNQWNTAIKAIMSR